MLAATGRYFETRITMARPRLTLKPPRMTGLPLRKFSVVSNRRFLFLVNLTRSDFCDPEHFS